MNKEIRNCPKCGAKIIFDQPVKVSGYGGFKGYCCDLAFYEVEPKDKKEIDFWNKIKGDLK